MFELRNDSRSASFDSHVIARGIHVQGEGVGRMEWNEIRWGKRGRGRMKWWLPSVVVSLVEILKGLA